MIPGTPDLSIEKLGECKVASPFRRIPFVDDSERVLFDSDPKRVREIILAGGELPSMEVAGPRETIFFDPAYTTCAIVTCGGLCPGVNDVIRAIVLSLFHHYGVKRTLGIRFGLEGLSSKYKHEPVELTPDSVRDIHRLGGSILALSRGPHDVKDMVANLRHLGVNILFTIGGDGTLRAAKAISDEARAQGYLLSVIGIPKTIDNDIAFVEKSFGFDTAATEARRAISAAHVEASGASNGIGLVKLMGRDSGFIAAHAVLANSEVNFCLVPEVPFTLKGFLEALESRVRSRHHAVVVIAEGAGQNLLPPTGEKDRSGNVRFGDVGVFLRDEITKHFRSIDVPINLKYIDPSYMIRSVPANAQDSAFCLLLGHHAVHAAMSGRTSMVIGYWRQDYTHIPIALTSSSRKHINPTGRLWRSVLACTGQPLEM